ncbi:MAG TPA: MerR family transcriptional regulator [Ktedonobacterales bacterium]|jgi:DNA-binding transcriptional MerR regulator
MEVTAHMTYTVGQVAKLAGVTVRALRHYDDLGLLRPDVRLKNGYRGYSVDDIERLQRILCYRQLGFPLDAVKAIIDDPRTDPNEHLRRQHALLSDRIKTLRRMLSTVETLMEARTMGITLEPHEMLEVFGDQDPLAHHAEAEQRWGGTDAWAESHRRTSSYTKDDWKRMRAEFAALMANFAAASAEGLAPDSPRAMDLAEEHRRHLERWFYPCAYPMHRGLGDLYVNDPRFTANLAKAAPQAPNIATYMRAAIHANADRNA